jgi:hypothetical protein
MKLPLELVVYRITNNLNGKIYIGRSCYGLISRFRLHRSLPPLRLNTIGLHNCTMEVIQRCDTIEELVEAEYNWIFNKSPECLKPNGYNGRGMGSVESNIASIKKKPVYKLFNELGNQANTPLNVNMIPSMVGYYDRYLENFQSGHYKKHTTPNMGRWVWVPYEESE